MFRLLERKTNISKKVAEVILILLPQLYQNQEIFFFEMFLSARSTNLFNQFYEFNYTDLKIFLQ